MPSTRRGALTVPLGALALAAAIFVPAAAEREAATEEVFKAHKSRVLRVRILEKSSGSQASVGSGFAVGDKGLAITNFHVVSRLVWTPESYRAAAVLDDGSSRGVVLLDVDVVRDLALLRLEGEALPGLPLAREEPLKGQRLYAMGNPHDLGMTIVEGSYSGLLEESLIQRVHFTGSVNAGMSGGPVVNAAGEAVGVCVASSGDQVSFLVPIRFVNPLLERGAADAPPEDLKARIAAQLTAHQEETVSRLVAAPLATQELGPFQVPGKPSAAFRCWAEDEESKNQPYQVVHSECTTNEEIFVNERLSTGRIRVMHHRLETERLNPFQFAALERRYLIKGMEGDGARMFMPGRAWQEDDDDLTPFDCASSLVAAGAVPMKGILCLRAYKEFPGLYDLRWQGASLVDSRSAVTTSLLLEGVTRQSMERFLRRYLEAFTWKR